jgi:hypothetical protein
MDNIDGGAYLTERLRMNHPEPFERQLAQNTRRALRGGFALGMLTMLIISGGIVGALVMVDSVPLAALFGAG